MEREEIFCRVAGKVQGVMYRDFIRRHARHSALTGYVKNLPGGGVEILAQGFRDDLEKFLEHARRGPFLARVSHIEIARRAPGEPHQSFEIVF